MHKGNHFNRGNIDKTNHISKRKALGFDKDIFDFSNALNSVNLELFEFVNYFKNGKSELFKFVNEECYCLVKGLINLDKRYEMKVVNVDDGFNELKIRTIYEKTFQQKIYKLPLMYKLKNIFKTNLQFYVTKENEVFKVCFIDIYHLAIPTKEQASLNIYEKNKDNKYGLDNIKL